jgi:hypothetical protein
MAFEAGRGSSHIAGEIPPEIPLPGDGETGRERDILEGVNRPLPSFQMAENQYDKRRAGAGKGRLDTARAGLYDIAWKGLFSPPA